MTEQEPLKTAWDSYLHKQIKYPAVRDAFEKEMNSLAARRLLKRRTNNGERPSLNTLTAPPGTFLTP